MKLARLGDGAEIFHTLQGEGAGIGAPAVFVRLSLCNLHCVWCDTDHTWNFEGTPWKHEKDALPGYAKHRKEDVIIEMGVDEVAEAVRGFGCRRVVLTGGEPLLRADVPELVRTLKQELGVKDVALTTNGWLLEKLAPALRAAGLDRLNVSVDSLDDATFRRMNDADFPVAKVLEGIDVAAAAGLVPETR